MEDDRLYSLLVVLAFLLGIIYLTDDNKKNTLEQAMEKSKRKVEKDTLKQVSKIRKNKVKPYKGPDYFQRQESEERVNVVCKSLFNIATILEMGTNTNIVNDENYKFLVEYYEDTQENILKEILTLIMDNRHELNFNYSIRKVINLKICEYLYNKGCERYSHEAMFNCVRNFRDPALDLL